MYIWSNKVPVGTVIPNPRTNRVQMVVASSGPGGVGAWQSLSRNVREDYKRAFGEEPGRLQAYGVLTDTDNTGESVAGLVRRHPLQAPRALTRVIHGPCRPPSAPAVAPAKSGAAPQPPRFKVGTAVSRTVGHRPAQVSPKHNTFAKFPSIQWAN